MNEAVQAVSQKQLPVLATIREAVEVSWKHRAILVRWIIGCTIFTSGFCYLMEFIFAHFNWVYADWKAIWIRVSFIFLSAIPLLMIYALFSVFCHRLVLANGKQEILGLLSFGKREWRFLGWNLVLCAAAIILIVFGFIFQKSLLAFLRNFEDCCGILVFFKPFLGKIIETYFVDVIYLVLGSYLLARYCLVLPATAVDLKPTFAWSSVQTKGNGWRLALLFGGVPFVFGFLYCPPSLLTWLQIDQLMIVKHVLRPFLVYLVTPIMVNALSIAFRDLTNWTSSQSHSEGAPVV